MSQEIFKRIYEANQILKKNFDRYTYLYKTNSFYGNNGNVIKLIKVKSDLMTTNFTVNDSSGLFATLKSVKVRDTVDFSISKNAIDIIVNSAVIPNLFSIDGNSKLIETSVDNLANLKVLHSIDMETTSLFNNDEDLGCNKKLEDFKSLLTQNRLFTNHLVFFLEIDLVNNKVKIHSKKTAINIANPFLIFEGNYLVKLPLITKKKEPEDYFKIELLERNHICLVYGNIDFETKIYFITA